MVGREEIIFLRLAETLLPRERITPRLVERAREYLAGTQVLVRIFFRVALHIFNWGTFFFRTAGSIEQFCLLSPRGRSRYIRFWVNHKRRIMRHLFQALRILVLSCFYDDRRITSRWK